MNLEKVVIPGKGDRLNEIRNPYYSYWVSCEDKVYSIIEWQDSINLVSHTKEGL